MTPRPVAIRYFCDDNKKWEYQDWVSGQYCAPGSEILFNRPNLEDSIEATKYQQELSNALARIAKLEKFILHTLI